MTKHFSDFGLDEGLGEPEEENINQKKIIARFNSKKVPQIKIKHDTFNDDSFEFDFYNVPKTSRNHQVINFYDYETENSFSSKQGNLSERFNKTDFINLYDP